MLRFPVLPDVLLPVLNLFSVSTDSHIRPAKCQVLVVVGLGNLKPAFNHIAGRLFLLRFCRLLDEIRELLHFLTSFLSVQPLRYTR